MSELTLKDIADRIDALAAAVIVSKPMMNIEEAARYVDLSVKYLYQLTSQQKIPHYKPIGKKLYFKRDELDAWMLSNKVKTEAEIEEAAVAFLVDRG